MWNSILNFFKKLLKNNNKGSVNKTEPEVIVTPEPEQQLPLPIDIPSESVGEIADFKFVDSSHHHPSFDVIAYKEQFPAGRAYLNNKCTQGTTFIDKTHAPRKKLCEANGVEYEGYHFYECRRDPIEQARFYVKTHGDFTTPPQVDYETSDTIGQTEPLLIKNKENLWKFIEEVKRLTGMWCILYVNYSASKQIKFDPKFKVCPPWFARYNSFLGAIPAPWDLDDVFAWQYTDSEKFPGFVGGNDVNIYYGKNNKLNLK